jgi:hypothetical protein
MAVSIERARTLRKVVPQRDYYNRDIADTIKPPHYLVQKYALYRVKDYKSLLTIET